MRMSGCGQGKSSSRLAPGPIVDYYTIKASDLSHHKIAELEFSREYLVGDEERPDYISIAVSRACLPVYCRTSGRSSRAAFVS